MCDVTRLNLQETKLRFVHGSDRHTNNVQQFMMPNIIETTFLNRNLWHVGPPTAIFWGSRPVGSPAYRRWGTDRSVPQKIAVGGPTCRLPRHCHKLYCPKIPQITLSGTMNACKIIGCNYEYVWRYSTNVFVASMRTNKLSSIHYV